MRSFELDLSPLFRSTIGYDRIGQLLESARRRDDQAVSYPPYNIERTGDDAYRIVMAIAGFGEEDLDVTVREDTLTVSGKIEDSDEEGAYLYRGIAGRTFERRFQLADHIRVDGAGLENGLLTIDLVRELPEALKPRQIAIETRSPSRKKAVELEHGKAA